MKDMSRAIRRHHAARLKKARRFYHARDLRIDPGYAGKVLNTPAVCSCWMCGNQRPYAGPKRAERLQMIDLANYCAQ
jgi:hypothetical protein